VVSGLRPRPLSRRGFESVSRRPALHQTASSDRIRNRPLFVQDKILAGSAQAPPPSSDDFLDALAQNAKLDAEDRIDAEEKARLLFRLDQTIQNLRAIYLHGTTFTLAYRTNKRQARRIIDQNPGMQLWRMPETDEYANGYWGESMPGLDDEGKSEHEYAREFFERQSDLADLTCGHSKSWRDECDACRLGVGTSPEWNQEQANTALARLGLSVWEGKNEMVTWGLGGDGSILDAGADVRDRKKHDRKTGRTVNAPDSFEGPREDVSSYQGQAYSRPDPNYALGLEISDDPNRQQSDVEQPLKSLEAEEMLKFAYEDHAWNEAHEKINDSSTDGEVEIVTREAQDKIAAQSNVEEIDKIDLDSPSTYEKGLKESLSDTA
jgi:hypothetical protein